MTTGYVWHELYAWHDTNRNVAGLVPAGLMAQPFAHFESPESKARFNSMVHVSGLIESISKVPAEYATEEDLLRVHTLEHVESIRLQSENGGGDGGDGGTPFGRGSYAIAKLAAGGTIAATRAVLDRVVDNAYALVRPPGHHARPETGMGFCIFANVAIAAEWARANRGVKRIAVVDWDVHHGNGTQACFEEDLHTLAISLHQDQLFPFNSGAIDEIGVGAGEGTNINVPLPAGTGNGGYIDAVRDAVVPALRNFRPEMIFIASGFDASALDPLGNQVVTSTGYREMTRLLMEAADELCCGRIVISHEGGYSPVYVPYCGLAVLEQLSGVRTGVEDPFEGSWAKAPAALTTEAQATVIAQAAELALKLQLTV